LLNFFCQPSCGLTHHTENLLFLHLPVHTTAQKLCTRMLYAARYGTMSMEWSSDLAVNCSLSRALYCFCCCGSSWWWCAELSAASHQRSDAGGCAIDEMLIRLRCRRRRRRRRGLSVLYRRTAGGRYALGKTGQVAGRPRISLPVGRGDVMTSTTLVRSRRLPR